MSKTLRDMQYKIDEIKKENERLKKISILYYKELSKNEKRELRKKAQLKFSCPKCSNVVFQGDTQCKHCGQEFDWSNT